MDQGKLEHQGVNALKSLRSMVQWQTLPYDFKFYQKDFEVNYCFIGIADGVLKSVADPQKNLLIFDTCVNHQTSNRGWH